MHEVFSPSVYGENAACNKILEKEERQKEIPSSPPLQMGRQEGNPHQQPGETTQRKPLLVAKPPYPSVEQPDSPQLILAFFDWLRGYPLPAELLPRAKAAAQTLFYGNEQTQQPGYSRFQVEQTALYLRDHDPVWKQNYHEWCSRTGIPDVWLVAKHIGSKWPLALRRLLESGDYLQMEDGSLWSKEEYQAYLQREQEVWQQQQQEGEDTSPLISWDTPREQPTNSDPTPSTMTQQENYLPTPDPAGWQELPLAQPQANRLRRAFPAYYHVELQPTENERWAIMIINDCLEDDGAIVTCNQQVCALVDAARQARVSPINWTLPTIAAWWATYLSRRLPSDWQIMADEQAEGCGITITTPQQHTTRLVNDEQVASWLHSLRSSRVKNNQHKSMIRS